MTLSSLEKAPKRKLRPFMINVHSNVSTWIQVLPNKRPIAFKHVIARNLTIQHLRMQNFIYEWKILIYFSSLLLWSFLNFIVFLSFYNWIGFFVYFYILLFWVKTWNFKNMCKKLVSWVKFDNFEYFSNRLSK